MKLFNYPWTGILFHLFFIRLTTASRLPIERLSSAALTLHEISSNFHRKLNRKKSKNSNGLRCIGIEMWYRPKRFIRSNLSCKWEMNSECLSSKLLEMTQTNERNKASQVAHIMNLELYTFQSQSWNDGPRIGICWISIFLLAREWNRDGMRKSNKKKEWEKKYDSIRSVRLAYEWEIRLVIQHIWCMPAKCNVQHICKWHIRVASVRICSVCLGCGYLFHVQYVFFVCVRFFFT